MRISNLLARNLAWYWRTNLAVLLGVATAAAVLGGALLVGDSVRGSLRDLVLRRLGDTQYIVSRNGFFREQLAASFAQSHPVIAVPAVVVHQNSGRRAFHVQIYGMPQDKAYLSAALASELGAQPGDTLLVRIEKPSAIPLESLHGRKEDVGKTIRFTFAGLAPRELSLSPQQGDVRAIYVPLARLQRELNQPGKVNAILIDSPTPPDTRAATLEDLGIKVRPLAGALSVETDGAVISDKLAARVTGTAQSLHLATQPVLTYLANTIRANGREIPYSVVTALAAAPAPDQPGGITLNDWAAHDLGAKPGDAVTLEYFVWKSSGRMETETASFHLSQIVPVAGAAADRDYAPDYPGITQTDSLHEWDPPFPIDLHRVRPADEQYWKQYRTTPKAFISLARGQQIWGSRFGKLTSIRVVPPSPDYAAKLRASLDPAEMGLTVDSVRARSLSAAKGATDFGEYFVYFSFFLVVSALLLTGLFFKLGVEQRLREIGILRALGYSVSRIRTLFLLEGAVLAVVGALAGTAGALAYGELLVYGLRTWWVDAVGTRLITLHPSPVALAGGAFAGILTGLATVAWTVRKLAPVTPRGLLTGQEKPHNSRRPLIIGSAALLLALVLLAASLAHALDQTAGFFGAGSLLLIAALSFESAFFNSRASSLIRSLVTLAIRNAAHRPGRSVLCIAQIAFATFLIVSLDAFRRDTSEPTVAYPLIAESALPLIYDLNTTEARDALNLPRLGAVRFFSFRLRPGDDTSCLNLYQPRNPRILGAPATFLASSAWQILDAPLPGGAIPALADANSLTYVLHLKVGDDFVLQGTHFRIVKALEDSLFQSEIVISEKNFLHLFPDVQGYRFFLMQAPPREAAALTGTLEDALSDYGFDVQSTAARLAGYHKVENTYLSTFRSLGGLGLVLGTIGLAAILLRNVLERSRELALLRAVGYRPSHLASLVFAENLLLLVLGLATGTLCALLAVVPAVSARGGHLPVASIGVLLSAVFLTGMAASLLATRAALRSPLLAALRSE